MSITQSVLSSWRGSCAKSCLGNKCLESTSNESWLRNCTALPIIQFALSSLFHSFTYRRQAWTTLFLNFQATRVLCLNLPATRVLCFCCTKRIQLNFTEQVLCMHSCAEASGPAAIAWVQLSALSKIAQTVDVYS